MQSQLESLRIDRPPKRQGRSHSAMIRWIIVLLVAGALFSTAWAFYSKRIGTREVETLRVEPITAISGAPNEEVILNATGYIVAAHKIEVASKIVGRVAWIGVDKGDKVQAGQVLVRLEDEEYRAQLQEAKGQLDALNARLAELRNGSRPEEVSRANADLAQAFPELQNAETSLKRTKQLVATGVLPQQALDDAQARYDAQLARISSLRKSFELVRLGPRVEEVDVVKGNIEEARGRVAYFENQLANTIIKSPVGGRILERAVERGEFVTNSFVGDRGAKGYVVSLADLKDLKVELDINQNDFAKLVIGQRAVITTDAFPDRKYDGEIDEISPEANRQKATVQVKVKILRPDDYLRPEMNANVSFLSREKSTPETVTAGAEFIVPASAIRENSVFVLVDGKARRRAVKSTGTTTQGVRIDNGLSQGEEIIINPPPDLKDGDPVRRK